jgi:transcriptional regulator with XRE-family HTH domain
MKYAKFRKSIHSKEHKELRNLWIESRNNLGLSQQQLADKMGVVYSLIGKIETGDRRLDVVEMVEYCQALNINPYKVIDSIKDSGRKIDIKDA